MATMATDRHVPMRRHVADLPPLPLPPPTDAEQGNSASSSLLRRNLMADDLMLISTCHVPVGRNRQGSGIPNIVCKRVVVVVASSSSWSLLAHHTAFASGLLSRHFFDAISIGSIRPQK